MHCSIPVWYIPTLYGDIRLEAVSSDPRRTRLIAEALTPLEADALRTLRDKHADDKVLAKAWASRDEWNSLGIDGELHSPFRSTGNSEIVLAATMRAVETEVSSALKGNRPLTRAVVFKAPGGGVTGVTTPEEAEKKAGETAQKPAAAATVKTPTRGCPVPEFERAKVRATRVLKAFLSPSQLVDFDAHQQVLVTGADTGRRYVLTSRHSERFDRVGRSSVYDLDQRMPICVHDWAVPAAEEILALMVHLLLPGGERFMLALPAHG